MLKLRIILLHDYLYYFIVFLAIIYFFIISNISYKEEKINLEKEYFIITSINIKDYGIELKLKGKEKVIGYYYIEETKEFINNYFLGDKVIIEGEILSIKNNTVENTFNYKKYLSNQKIYKTIKIYKITKKENNKNVFYTIKNILLKRGYKLQLSYPYINSLIFGNNNFIDSYIKSSYQENGISHLFAISGLHITIFVNLLDKFLKALKIKENKQYFLIIIFLLFYMFLANYSMSILRGAIFSILIIINKQYYFNIKTVNLLLLTISIITFINPMFLYNIGLQFSFIITLYLVLFSNLINKEKSKIKQLLITSIISFLASYPIVINNFYQINILSIIYNLIFVPYVSFIILPLTIVCYIFPFLDKALHYLIIVMEKLSLFLTNIDFFKIILCKMSPCFIIIYYILITIVLYMLMNKKKQYYYLIIIFFLIHYLSPLKKETYFMVFDVGQGDSSLLVINKSVTLIDTGGITNYYSDKVSYANSKNKIIPYLKSKGIRKIDNLILTHGDADHMLEGIYIVSNFKVDKVIFNVGEYNKLESNLINTLNKKNIKYNQNINSINIDKYKLHFLNTKTYNNENDNSNVVYTNINNVKILLMGDAGITREHDILQKHNIENVDILKIGHHGSNSSTSKEFVKSINPKTCLISVGSNNRYNHPNKSVLNIINKCNIYRTDLNGSIKIELKNNNYNIKKTEP